MSISISRVDGIEPTCTSQCERHKDTPAPSVLILQIGEHASPLCEECAVAAVNLLAYMTSTIAGKTIPDLLGFGRRKK